MRLLPLGFCAVLFSAAALPASALDLKAGNWESTIRMTAAGQTMPEQKRQDCVTPEQVKQGPEQMLKQALPQSCDIKVKSSTNTEFAYTVACKAPQEMSGQGSIKTKGSEAYDSEFTATAKGPDGKPAEMKMVSSSRRVGNCP